MPILSDRIDGILRRFPNSSKLQLARELAELLEWQEGETLRELVTSALGRDLQDEEVSRLRSLDLALADGGRASPEFPDGIGTKAGL